MMIMIIITIIIIVMIFVTLQQAQHIWGQRPCPCRDQMSLSGCSQRWRSAGNDHNNDHDGDDGDEHDGDDGSEHDGDDGNNGDDYENDDEKNNLLHLPPWLRLRCPSKSGDFFPAPEFSREDDDDAHNDAIGDDDDDDYDGCKYDIMTTMRLTSWTTSARPGS